MFDHDVYAERVHKFPDMRFIKAARSVAHASPDPDTKVGAVLIGRSGKFIEAAANDLPLGLSVDDVPELVRPVKYDWLSHAEKAVIARAAAQGRSTSGGTIYVNLFPCAGCAKAIIDAGIRRIVTIRPNFENDRYGPSWKVSEEMFRKLRVEVVFADFGEGLIAEDLR